MAFKGMEEITSLGIPNFACSIVATGDEPE